MSGHSKFANIKHKKEKNDAAKGKIFTIIGREIAVAVKDGGADPNNNSKLRDVIAKAKANNMPNDTIERGIKKAAGDLGSVNYENNTYEGYGPSGVAIIVETLTDNKNRTAANVRSAFTKGNGSIGTTGCVSFMFDKKGQIIIDREECDMDPDDLMMLALDAGAEDFVEEEDSYLESNIRRDIPGTAEIVNSIVKHAENYRKRISESGGKYHCIIPTSMMRYNLREGYFAGFPEEMMLPLDQKRMRILLRRYRRFSENNDIRLIDDDRFPENNTIMIDAAPRYALISIVLPKEMEPRLFLIEEVSTAGLIYEYLKYLYEYKGMTGRERDEWYEEMLEE